MDLISLPSQISVHKEGQHEADVIIEPCYPGYGTTLGNALRRVLISSMPGAAIVSAYIKNVPHEFTTLPGVKEDIVQLMMNLKSVRIKMDIDESQEIILQVKGEKIVTAEDFKAPTGVTIINTDQHIATLTEKNSNLDMRLKVQKGRGYIPAEMQQKIKHDLGVIILDAKYSPVKNVNFLVENVRVGEFTNFDKLTLHVSTDGTMTPEVAVHTAAQILIDHFSKLLQNTSSSEEIIEKKKSLKSKKKEDKS